MERKKPKRGGRHNIQVFTDDIVAIRKMRISRKITRDDAGKAIGVSGKTIERIENGEVLGTQWKNRLTKDQQVSSSPIIF